MTWNLKEKLKKFRQLQVDYFNLHGKNIKPLPDIYAELMLEIINDLEEEMFGLEMWSNR